MYSKLELAQLYFPDAIDKSVARRHLMAWIQQCVPLWQNIQRMGYRKGSQFFTPRMVKCIVDYLGGTGVKYVIIGNGKRKWYINVNARD